MISKFWVNPQKVDTLHYVKFCIISNTAFTQIFSKYSQEAHQFYWRSEKVLVLIDFLYNAAVPSNLLRITSKLWWNLSSF